MQCWRQVDIVEQFSRAGLTMGPMPLEDVGPQWGRALDAAGGNCNGRRRLLDKIGTEMQELAWRRS